MGRVSGIILHNFFIWLGSLFISLPGLPAASSPTMAFCASSVWDKRVSMILSTDVPALKVASLFSYLTKLSLRCEFLLLSGGVIV